MSIALVVRSVTLFVIYVYLYLYIYVYIVYVITLFKCIYMVCM
jgi:hypothetical protein